MAKSLYIELCKKTLISPCPEAEWSTCRCSRRRQRRRRTPCRGSPVRPAGSCTADRVEGQASLLIRLLCRGVLHHDYGMENGMVVGLILNTMHALRYMFELFGLLISGFKENINLNRANPPIKFLQPNNSQQKSHLLPLEKGASYVRRKNVVHHLWRENCFRRQKQAEVHSLGALINKFAMLSIACLLSVAFLTKMLVSRSKQTRS
jgi:hypothetical protein